MKVKRNAFTYFALAVYTAVVLYAVACAWQRLGAGQEYPYYIKGVCFVALSLGICAAAVFGVLWARLNISQKASLHPAAVKVAEVVCICAVTAAGVAVRLIYIAQNPMQPESDFKTYYEIAQLLNDGTLLEKGIGYCDYVAMFPHVLGYPAMLALLFRLFGTSVAVAQYFNVFCSAVTALLVWRITCRLTGRIGGFAAMLAVTFWPSQILFSNFTASEPFFTMLLMLCLLIFIVQMQDYGDAPKHPGRCVGLLLILGVLMAVTGAVRPMVLLLLISAVICMLGQSTALPARLRNDISLAARAINKGWKRCLILVVTYVLCSSFVSICVAYTVDRTLASGSASFGYNLLVGLNTESYGGWNQEDSDYLYSVYNETGDATQAHLACRDLAVQRIKTDPRAIVNLFAHKFEVLWGNDDYGASWNILFMDQQGTLTPQRESFYYNMMDVSDMYYLAMLIFAGVAGLAFWRKRSDASYTAVLVFLGTVAMHLLVENQNRYHYHTLPLLAIFVGVAVSYVLESCNALVRKKEMQKLKELDAKNRREQHIAELEQEEKRIEVLRVGAMHQQFDMEKALREGHINITVSKAVEDESKKGR